MCLAVPGRVISLTTGGDDLSRSGKVSFGGVVKEVSLAFVPEVKVGDYVVVHVGFALSIVDEAEANKVFDYLRQMDELTELQPGEEPEAEPAGEAGIPDSPSSSQTRIGS